MVANQKMRKSYDRAGSRAINDFGSINDHFDRTSSVGQLLLTFEIFFYGVIVSLIKPTKKVRKHAKLCILLL